MCASFKSSSRLELSRNFHFLWAQWDQAGAFDANWNLIGGTEDRKTFWPVQPEGSKSRKRLRGSNFTVHKERKRRASGSLSAAIVSVHLDSKLLDLSKVSLTLGNIPHIRGSPSWSNVHSLTGLTSSPLMLSKYSYYLVFKGFSNDVLVPYLFLWSIKADKLELFSAEKLEFKWIY